MVKLLLPTRSSASIWAVVVVRMCLAILNASTCVLRKRIDITLWR